MKAVAESEKLTINLGFVDLGHIDLLVQEGFYSNRSDFVRAAIRKQLADYRDDTRKVISRDTLDLGIATSLDGILEQAKSAGSKLRIRVLGLASIAPDVSPALARATIESITVLGAFHASDQVKKALADRLA